MPDKTSDDNHRVCPYCEHEHYVEEHYEKPEVLECEKCEKKFWARDVTTISHETNPDCKLNGRTCQPGQPPLAMYCRNCGNWIEETEA